METKEKIQDNKDDLQEYIEVSEDAWEIEEAKEEISKDE